MNKKIPILLIALIFLSGCASKNNYLWQDKEAESKYKNITWKPISTKKLDGFGSSEQISEKKTEKCIDNYDTPYLRTEGGMCGIGYWLEKTNDKKIIKIDSLEKLKSEFLPIENESKAISFLSTISSDLKIINDIPVGQIATTEDGFLLEITHKNTFGCGQHEPTKEIVKILKNGEIKTLASEKAPIYLKPEMCVD